MILISHRGNTDGKNIDLENHPVYIKTAISKGFDVEIDIWKHNEKLYLGHDYPQHEFEAKFLLSNKHKLWCHAKNIDALEELIILQANCFWHQDDDVTLTTSNHIWTYPGKKLTEKSVCVLPEITDYKNEEILKCYGVCSDVICEYENLLS